MIGEECRFPCPYCGAEFHFTAGEIRNSVPCSKCSKDLIMPLGRVSRDRGQVFGLARGGLTGGEWDELFRLQATDAIRRWEEVTTRQSSSPEERKDATWAVVRALFPKGKKSFVMNGKRYKVISNAKVTEIRVTPVPQKKRN
jgi:hypothetical protein